jgi:hypothetical protein
MFDNPRHIAKVLLRGSAPAATVAPIAAVQRTASPRRSAGRAATA